MLSLKKVFRACAALALLGASVRANEEPLFRFALVADANVTTNVLTQQSWRDTLADASARGLEFVIGNGDMVYDGGKDANWDLLAGIAEPADVKVYFAPSNHETQIVQQGSAPNVSDRLVSLENFEARTGYPRGYRFRHGPAAFVVSYNAGLYRGDLSSYEFLDESLQLFDADPTVAHVFVVDAFGGLIGDHFPHDTPIAGGTDRDAVIDGILADSAARTGLQRPVVWLSGDTGWVQATRPRFYEVGAGDSRYAARYYDITVYADHIDLLRREVAADTLTHAATIETGRTVAAKYLEAESPDAPTDTLAPWVRRGHPGAWDNAYLGQQNTGGPGIADYTFEFAAEADVMLWARVDLPAADAEVFQYRLDDGAWQTYSGRTDGWEWVELGGFPDLAPGPHTLGIRRVDPGVRLDRFYLATDFSAPSDDALTFQNPRANARLQAEDAALAGVTFASSLPGYSGSGYVQYAATTARKSVAWTVTTPVAGSYLLDFRFSNGSAAARNLLLAVNSHVEVEDLSFPQTGGWDHWSNLRVAVPLAAGENTIELSTTSSTAPYLDFLRVPLPAHDFDGDGLPDNYERRFGLDPRDPTDAAGDRDHDRQTNAAEHAFGTAPDVSTDFLALRPGFADESLSLHLDALAGTAYQLWTAPTPAGPWTFDSAPAANPADGPFAIALPEPTNGTPLFYQITVGEE